MDTTSPVAPPVPVRSGADRVVRRVLRLDPDAPKASLFGASKLFGNSIAVSAVRCLVTYVAIPLLGPVLGLSDAVGPWLGLVLGLVSMVAIVVATRRFFAADHPWRWGYLAVGGSIFCFLVVATVVDVARIAT